MKKHVALFLVFTLLCGLLSACGTVASTDEPTASPTEISEATVTPSADETPTEGPEATQSPEEDPYWDTRGDDVIFPENYSDLQYDYSYMRSVVIPDFLRNDFDYKVRADYRYTFGPLYCDQYLSYDVNMQRDPETDLDVRIYDRVLIDVVNMKVVDQLHLNFEEEPEKESVLLKDHLVSYPAEDEKLKAECDKILDEHFAEKGKTTVAKETKGILSGGIFDMEYSKELDIVTFAHSGKYALVDLSISYEHYFFLSNSSVEDEGTGFVIDWKVTQNGSGNKRFALIDMDKGTVVKTYMIWGSHGPLYPCNINIQFSDDDDYIILYYSGIEDVYVYPQINYVTVIDIEASLQSEE